MKIHVDQLRNKVWHFRFLNQYDLTASFMRMQEYYESPYMEIRNHFFSHEKFMDVYAQKKGTMSYFEDWSGFNVPGNIVRKYHELFRYDYWYKESQIMRLIEDHIPEVLNGDDKFYIIGTYEKDEDFHIALQHELAHAYWYLYPEYSKTMQSFIDNKLDKQKKGVDYSTTFTDGEIIWGAIQDLGYDASVSFDETQAYLATSTRSDLIETLGDEIAKLRIPTCFHKYFNEFDLDQQEQQKGVVDEGKHGKRDAKERSRVKTGSTRQTKHRAKDSKD